MDALVAVYSDWGIGAKGTQPVVIKGDRLRFRMETDGAAVIVGRKTMEDFPGGRPLKNRHNIVVTRQDIQVQDAVAVHTLEEALAEAAKYERCFVIGGASVFQEFFPHIDRVLVTKIELCPHSDSFFPDLDRDPAWVCAQAEPWQEEDGIRFRFCTYVRK